MKVMRMVGLWTYFIRGIRRISGPDVSVKCKKGLQSFGLEQLQE